MKINTFLPDPNFKVSAICLDDSRLGKQRVEVLQLLNTLKGHSTGWKNHPCIKMWKHNVDALVVYGLEICSEWQSRGFQDTCFSKILALKTVDFFPTQQNVPMPSWLGDPDFHASHRGNLLRKDRIWYGKFNWLDSPFLFYVWPVGQPLQTNLSPSP